MYVRKYHIADACDSFVTLCGREVLPGVQVAHVPEAFESMCRHCLAMARVPGYAGALAGLLLSSRRQGLPQAVRR